MPLSDQQKMYLVSARKGYSFRSLVWENKPVDLQNIEEVEAHIGRRLVSDNLLEIKEGLVSVVCWGWSSTELYPYRSARAAAVSDLKIAQFIQYRTGTPKGNIQSFSRLRLPQLGQMSFGTKVLAFMHPDNRAVLDKKLLLLLNASTFGSKFGLLTMRGQVIPVTAWNASLYEMWCRCCRIGATQMGNKYRAVDFERAVFQLALAEQHTAAIECLDGVVEDFISAPKKF